MLSVLSAFDAYTKGVSSIAVLAQNRDTEYGDRNQRNVVRNIRVTNERPVPWVLMDL